MDIIISGVESVFSIFGSGFIAGAMFAVLISQIFSWIHDREKAQKQTTHELETLSTYQA
jgi:xanthine/uracil permease